MLNKQQEKAHNNMSMSVMPKRQHDTSIAMESYGKVAGGGNKSTIDLKPIQEQRGG